MPRQHRRIQLPPVSTIFLCVLGGVYLVYLLALGNFAYTWVSARSETIIEHPVNTNPDVVIKHWTMASMRNAIDADQQINNASALTQESIDTSQGKAAQQEGQPPRNGNPAYPLSTVGKVFFTSSAGQDYVCSGTAVASLNQSVVDSAGHCLYWNGDWVKNMIFCPLYENGSTPYGCWAARDLEVPSDWIDAR
ncbi:MAG: trypsin-like serine peptidase, partial [Ktedonobacteraceae bacterium]